MEDLYLPEFLLRFMVGGPSFTTIVKRAYNGRECRFASHSLPINRYTVEECRLTTKELRQLEEFFCLAKGCESEFYLKDPNYYKVSFSPLLWPNKKAPIVQLADFCSSTLRKIILKPELASLTLEFQGQHCEGGHYLGKGLIDLSNTQPGKQILEEPSSFERLKASFNFFIPVRFDADRLKYRADIGGYVRVEPFELVEVF
jgi:hypothetical protein